MGKNTIPAASKTDGQLALSVPSAAELQMLRRIQLWRPKTKAELSTWVTIFLGMKMPEKPVCRHHQTPLDYLAHSFLEGADSDPPQNGQPVASADAVIWACRGGGKTMLGAIATLLDLLFKPDIQVRILGGSFEQSDKMYAYLRALLQRHFDHQLAAAPTQRRLLLKNGARVDVLAQSDRSVRGQRVQKLRCDEIELFDPAVWQAAQLTTRSLGGPNPIRGAIEAFSTMHKPGGLMQSILAETAGSPALPPASIPALPQRKRFAWCIWDVIEKCPASRPCAPCPLFDGCQGRAKEAQGFVKIDDVIAMRSRISKLTWNHEMLCQPPRFEDAVFPAFRRETHVRRADTAVFFPQGRIAIDGRHFIVESIICGVDFGYAHAFVCLWIAMLRPANAEFRILNSGSSRAAWVFDELVTSEQTVAKNAAAIRARPADPSVLYCDVAGRHPNSQTARSDESILRDAGFTTRARTMQIHDGIEWITDLLDPASGPPRLFIAPGCSRLIDAMEGYRKKSDGSPDKDGRHDHLIDALRYALVNHDRPLAKVDIRHY